MQYLPLAASQVNLLYQLLDFLAHSIRTHIFRSRFFVLHHDLCLRLCLLLRSRPSHIRFAALKCLRACIPVQEEHLIRHLIKVDVFGPILQILKETRGKYNLINSSCLELFEFIRKVCPFLCILWLSS